MRSSLKTFVSVATAVAGVLLLAGSCVSTGKRTDWTGHRIDEALAKFGTPSTVTPGENGEKTYIWLLHRSVPVQRMTFDSMGNPVYSTVYKDSVHTYMFAVNAAGIITSWQQNANNMNDQVGY